MRIDRRVVTQHEHIELGDIDPLDLGLLALLQHLEECLVIGIFLLRHELAMDAQAVVLAEQEIAGRHVIDAVPATGCGIGQMRGRIAGIFPLEIIDEKRNIHSGLS